MNKGVFTFSGGTDRLIGLMAEELEKNGVTICTKAKVERIVIESGRVRGVQVGEKFIAAGCVVSNAGILNTIDDLAGREAFSAEFLDKVRPVKVNNSSCQVYMGIKEGERSPMSAICSSPPPPRSTRAEEMLDRETRSRTFSLYYPKTRPGHDRYTIVASMNGRYEDWADLPEERYATGKGADDRTQPGRSGTLPARGARSDRLAGGRHPARPSTATPCTPGAPPSAPSSRGWRSRGRSSRTWRGSSTSARWGSS